MTNGIRLGRIGVRFGVALLVALAFGGGCVSEAAAAAAESGFHVSLQDPLDGSKVQLKPGPAALHVVFFATWCPPCVAELDRLSQLEARWEDRGYRLVLIAVQTRQTRQRLAEFIEERHPPGRLLFDVDGQAERTLGGGQLPTHLLFDAQGREVLRTDGLDAAVKQALEKMLGGSEGAARAGS